MVSHGLPTTRNLADTVRDGLCQTRFDTGSGGMTRDGSTQLVADLTGRGSTQSQGVEEFKELGNGAVDGLRNGDSGDRSSRSDMPKMVIW